jgi:hypothetical protein
MWTNSVEVCQRVQRTSSWTRGLLSPEEREEYLKAQSCQDYRRRKFTSDSMYILSLYPIFFGYSLRGYSHREHWSCTQW